MADDQAGEATELPDVSGLGRRRLLQLAAVGSATMLWPETAQGLVANPPVSPIFTFVGGASEGGVLAHSMLTSRDIGAMVDLAVSDSPDMRNARLVGSQPVDTDGIVRHSVTGLQPDRTYFAQLADVHKLIGGTARFTTMPSPSQSWSRKIAVVSCMGNAKDSTTTELAWEDIEAWGADDIWHLGDFGYWGGLIRSGDPYQKDLQRYARAMNALPTMRSALQSAGLNAVTISDHELADNGDPAGGIHNSKASIRELIAFQKLFPIRTYGDTRVPRRGRYYSYDIGAAVRVIVTDFRSPDRSNTSDPDGPNKTMFGQTQLSWLFATLDLNKVNLLVHETSWLADPVPDRRAADKPWSYRYEQQLIADFIREGSYRVAWVGGDRHYVGYLAGAGAPHNTLGEFPCYISSGMSKLSLKLQAGELMTWQFGANMTDPQLPVCGYMQLTLSYNAASDDVTLAGLGRAVLDTTGPLSTWEMSNIPGGDALDRWDLATP